jgi:hypothetical protein
MKILLWFLLLALAACGSDRNDPSPPPLVLINLGDSLTNGVQSGTVSELTQPHGFAPLLAGQLAKVRPLAWNNPLLDPATGDRLQPGLLPHNLGVGGATAQSLVKERSGAGNLLLDRLLLPIPELAGQPVSQLEAARFVAARNAGRPILFTLWIGNNDLLGVLTADGGSALAAARIEAFLADSVAGHDLATVRSQLTLIVETLRAVPGSHLFIANLPETARIGFLLDRTDLETLALFPAPALSALPPGAAVGFGPFLTGIAPFLGTDNATLNTAVAAVAAVDGNVLATDEAALLSARIADHAHQGAAGAQAGDVERDVGGAARPVLGVLDVHHRNRCFLGNTTGVAQPVTVEHDVADHQHVDGFQGR